MNWNLTEIENLKSFLRDTKTKGFIVLVDGKIVLEEYYNNHTKDKMWQWNSSGKTLLTATVGIAQQEGFLTINKKVSDYLGEGWTNAPLEKESLITSKHLLTMTSGLNDKKYLMIKRNLTYLADAGNRWLYHNVFQQLKKVVSKSTNTEFNTYFNLKIKNIIGMDGYWQNGLFLNIYHSTARSMARFGLLALNKGKWKNKQVVNNNYFNESIQSSQQINPAYDYMWWLNGQDSFMLPRSRNVYKGNLIPNAPKDMFAAMGYKEQRIYVVPSKNMVIVRQGKSFGEKETEKALSGFDNLLWEKLNLVINK